MSPSSINQNSIQGPRGVRLKEFERALLSLLPHVSLHYTELPPHRPPRLPAAVRMGSGPGQVSSPQRVLRKQQQVESLLACVFALLPSQAVPFTIVDFGGGSGHVAIPLALVLPQCRVIVVDLGLRSLQLLHSKARACMEASDEASQHDDDAPIANQLATTAIPNLFTFYGPLQSFSDSFDMGIALHLCGEATDAALRLCTSHHAMIVACPCCVGKLNRFRKNPYIWQATGSNTHSIHYPQSQIFQQHLQPQSLWNALAQAADYSSASECRGHRNAARRCAKALVEMDRCLWLHEQNYATTMTRIVPWEATPKNDILVAWPQSHPSLIATKTDMDCMRALHYAMDHVFGASRGSGAEVAASITSDWSYEDEVVMRQKLDEFCKNSAMELYFPPPMTRGERKLVHGVAEEMGLAHWCVGEKSSEKTVAVAKPGTRAE